MIKLSYIQKGEIKMLIYQFTKNKLMPSAPMDLETLNHYLHVQNDYVNKLGIVYNKKGQKICEVDTFVFSEKERTEKMDVEPISKWWTSYNKDEKVWFHVNLETRRVEFCYELDSEGGVYKFTLLYECRDDVQETLKEMLSDENIEIITVEDNRDFYTIVTNSNLIFQK